jgi:hypothetical protein
MKNKNILIFLNTSYHVETALSIYESVRQVGYIPYILIDFIEEKEDKSFGLTEFLDKFGLNYLKPQQFDNLLDDNFFHRMFVVTASHHAPSVQAPAETHPPHNYNHRMRLYKDRAILIYHRSNFHNYLKYNNIFFENPKCLSVSQVSQKYGLEHIFQTENPIAKPKISFFNKDLLNFLLIGRFKFENRNIELLRLLPIIDKQLTKKIKIDLIGESSSKNILLTSFFKDQNFKNIEYEFYWNLEQIDFYKKIYNSDYLLNLILDPSYFERFTSNINHIVAFSKPNLSPLALNLMYNIPGFNYIQNFEEVFIQTTNLSEEKYIEAVSIFEVAKSNMRNHNSKILNTLFN